MSDPGGFPRRMTLMLLLMLPSLLSAGIYSWTDENGKVHYGDRPPVDRNAERVTVRVNTYESPSEITQVDSRTSSAPRGKVIVYTTQRCGYCKKAKKFLKRNNIRYTEYDVETSAKGKRDYKKLKGTGVPIILVGNQRMNGFSEGRLAGLLKNAGYK
ncbi:MAG TPA: glutaredoxin family protein [Gammaproteobacteria bacterium]|nr:glutaredoxin family protein [Gammaproteobacteria bacterium]